MEKFFSRHNIQKVNGRFFQRPLPEAAWYVKRFLSCRQYFGKKKSYDIELAAPGLSKGDFNIIVNNGVLTITSDRSTENEDTDDGYTSREFSYTSFSRSFTLPNDVDDEHINAKYKDGILHIQLPREVVEEENEASRIVPIQ